MANMSRKMRRASAKNGLRLQQLPWNDFEDVTDSPRVVQMRQESPERWSIDKMYTNNRYIVMVHFKVRRGARMYTKVMCRRSDAKPIYSWPDLFRIKNEIFGNEVEAVQFLPRKSELVDDANLYWFFIPEE